MMEHMFNDTTEKLADHKKISTQLIRDNQDHLNKLNAKIKKMLVQEDMKGTNDRVSGLKKRMDEEFE